MHQPHLYFFNLLPFVLPRFTFYLVFVFFLITLPFITHGKIESNVIVKSWRAGANEHVFCEILEPPTLAYFYKLSPAKDFGTEFNFTFHATQLVFAQPAHGCSPLSNAIRVSGRVVALERGGCSFMSKAIAGHRAGALAVVVYDNEPESDAHVSMVDDGTHREVGLPAVFMSGKDGHTIRKTMESLGSNHALISIPVNVTTHQMYMVKQAPWNLW